jgi:hypothetical protein
MSVLVSDILLSSLWIWTDILENERRRKPQPLFAVNHLRKVGEGLLSAGCGREFLGWIVAYRIQL